MECEEILHQYKSVAHLSKKNKSIVEHVDKVINELSFDGLDSFWQNKQVQLQEKVGPLIDEYLFKFQSVNSQNYQLENISFWKHEPLEYAPLHYDKEWIVSKGEQKHQRNFLCLIYLNDEFESGELVFPLQGKVIKPEAGMLVIFPTSFMFPHHTNPPIGFSRNLLRVSYTFDESTLGKGPREVN